MGRQTIDGRWVTKHLTNQPNTNKQKHISQEKTEREKGADTYCSPKQSTIAKPLLRPVRICFNYYEHYLPYLPHTSLKDYHLTKAQPPASLTGLVIFHSNKKGVRQQNDYKYMYMYTHVIKKNHADRLQSFALCFPLTEIPRNPLRFTYTRKIASA